MAVVAQAVTPVRTFTPFEGLSEAQRLWSAVPRGIVRFQSTVAIDAKPVNDDLLVQVTCSLPPSFAYIITSLSWMIASDVAVLWEDFVRGRVFNGLPGAAPGNEQHSIFRFQDFSDGVANTKKILNFDLGTLSDWYPQPLTRSPSAAGMSFVLNAVNKDDTVSAAGTQFFNAAFYQYELNQAVRFPLNFPLPVGQR